MVDDPSHECGCITEKQLNDMFCAPEKKGLRLAQRGRTAGGYGAERYATADEEEMFEDLMDEIEEKSGKTFGAMEVIKVRSQVVNGTNYIAKIEAISGNNPTRHHYEYMLVKVYKPISGDAQLVEVKDDNNKTITYDSPIGSF